MNHRHDEPMNHRHDERDGAQAVDCADVVLRLFEFVDNETGPVDQERIQEHLDECGSCLAEYERDLLIKALVRRACACEQAPAALREVDAHGRARRPGDVGDLGDRSRRVVVQHDAGALHGREAGQRDDASAATDAPHGEQKEGTP